jgi:hypothetical protein
LTPIALSVGRGDLCDGNSAALVESIQFRHSRSTPPDVGSGTAPVVRFDDVPAEPTDRLLEARETHVHPAQPGLTSETAWSPPPLLATSTSPCGP